MRRNGVIVECMMVLNILGAPGILAPWRGWVDFYGPAPKATHEHSTINTEV